MDSLHISLPAPLPGNLKRQIGVSIDGTSLSPNPVSRSISSGSQESDCRDDKIKKQLMVISLVLNARIRNLEESISAIQNGIQYQPKTGHTMLIERKIQKEKEVALLLRKGKKLRALLRLFDDE